MNSFNIGFFVILLFVGSVISSKDPVKHAECLEKNKLSEEEFSTILKAAMADSPDIDERMKCYTHCMLESMGHLDDNGKLDLSTLDVEDDGMTEDDIKIAEKCKDEYEGVEEKCEYSYMVSTCVAKAMKLKAIEKMESDGVQVEEE
ncbi:general odorant-binding protein 57c-like [Musca autumnalis]|uniref:general odorant-binding protein 57c-like n=1 Tax=Musca autumnalis TaxID=221902 RepID=UPI003CED6A9E